MVQKMIEEYFYKRLLVIITIAVFIICPNIVMANVICGYVYDWWAYFIS